jgi:hypothetical protein
MKNKTYLFLVFLLICFTNNLFAQNNADLCKYKIVPLNKKDTDGTKILAGIANIRYKKNTQKGFITNDNHSSINSMLSIANQDFKVIDCYVSNANKISNQKERFNKYPKEQQQKILELEDILLRTFIIEFSPDIDVINFCKNILIKYPDIEIAEPYYIDHFTGIPNDPDVNKQSVLRIIQAFQA